MSGLFRWIRRGRGHGVHRLLRFRARFGPRLFDPRRAALSVRVASSAWLSGWLPAEALPDWDELELIGRVNGEARQSAPLRDMLYRPARALAELSHPRQLVAPWLQSLCNDLVDPLRGEPSGK